MIRHHFLLAAGVTALPGCLTEPAPLTDLKMVWSDEFDGPAGQLPKPANWQFDIRTDWGNGRLECDTDRAANASLDGSGHLVITALQESYQCCAYTSARITTAGKREFRFVRGPIFANIILADEINRTPPKTQAALLEAMQEHQVTAAGIRYSLEEPFFVLASQNPIGSTYWPRRPPGTRSSTGEARRPWPTCNAAACPGKSPRSTASATPPPAGMA